MTNNFKVKNKQDEKIDLVVEGNSKAEITIIFVHGFGTDKNETANLFPDIAKPLQAKFRIVRFDLTGYGESEGKQEEADYKKHAEDLKSIINTVRKNYGSNIYILAMSMGCFVTSLASPNNIKKIILLSIPNHNVNIIIERLKNRFLTRPGSVLNEKGVSLFMRSTGKIQKIGPCFWQVLKDFKPLETVKNLAEKTDLMIIHPLQDEIIGNEYVEKYKEIPNLKYIEVNGNHFYKKMEDREEVIKIILQFFSNYER